jgi:two-component system chemotaxis response regulator CheB
MAERVLSDVSRVSGLGTQVPYNCPDCGGVLRQIAGTSFKRFRCHTGHSYTADSLVGAQSAKIEETLWVFLRMFEERKNLFNVMAEQSINRSLKKSYSDRAKETEIHIDRIRTMLISPSAAAAAK